MATRAEMFRAQAQRKGKSKKKKKKKSAPKRKARRTHTEAKATYAREPGGSRKSTRKSANRVKPDSAFNITEEVRKSAPTPRHDRAVARTRRPRGKR